MVVVGVEDQAAEGRVRIPLRRRHPRDEGVEKLDDALARLGAHVEDRVGGDAKHPLDLGREALGVGAGQVDLVQDGHDLEVVVDGLVGVRERLGLDALGRVDQEDGALARGQAARDLVAEVDVAGRVDQMENALLPRHPNVLGLDGDAALALELHRVEVLLAHVAWVDGGTELQDAIGERRLAVVDVADRAEVADALGRHHVGSILTRFLGYPDVR